MLHLLGLGLSFIARLSSASENNKNTHVQSLAEQLRKLIDMHYRDNWSITDYGGALASRSHLLDKAARAIRKTNQTIDIAEKADRSKTTAQIYYSIFLRNCYRTWLH